MAEEMKLTPFEDILTEFYGDKGSPRRDEHEQAVEDAVQAFHIGEAIRQARQEKNLTQEQLGVLMGVQKAQVSRIESGKNLNFSTIARAFKAMGIPANLAFGRVSLALW